MLPENQGRIFQQRRNLPENLSSKEFRTATAFSSFLSHLKRGPNKLWIITSGFQHLRISWATFLRQIVLLLFRKSSTTPTQATGFSLSLSLSLSLILVNLFLIKLVRISGSSSLLLAIRSQYFQHILPESAKNTAIALRKREENPEILTSLMRKRLTRMSPQESFNVSLKMRKASDKNKEHRY